MLLCAIMRNRKRNLEKEMALLDNIFLFLRVYSSGFLAGLLYGFNKFSGLLGDVIKTACLSPGTRT